MKTNFNDLDWHDAELQSIFLDRHRAGDIDEIIIVVCWPNETTDEITFRDCYAFEAKMNFGIIATESILKAECTQCSELLDTIKSKWEQSGIDFGDLGQYSIETNSTNSRLIICARGFSMKRVTK